MFTIFWHNRVFEETAIGIEDCLFLMGFRVERVFFHRHENVGHNVNNIHNVHKVHNVHIILGFHRYKGPTPKNTIVVQSEQQGSKWMTEEYINRLRGVDMVWDFSENNCDFMRCHGVNSYYVPTRVPLRVFVENIDDRLVGIPDSSSRYYIDVLFYGTFHERRRRVEMDLKRRGLNVVFRYSNLFENERDQLISVSKVVLNIHYWPESSLETHRIEYLCSRSKCVVSERSSDEGLDDVYKNSVVFCDIKDFVDTVMHLVKDEKIRQKMEIIAQNECYDRQMNPVFKLE